MFSKETSVEDFMWYFNTLKNVLIDGAKSRISLYLVNGYNLYHHVYIS